MLLTTNILSILISSYLTVSTAAYFGQGQMLYRPSRRDAAGLGKPPLLPWRDSNGNFLGYYRPSETPTRVVVFFHGMGGEALNWAWYDRIIPQNQILILAEYPGYGARSGKPSQQTLFNAAEQILDQARHAWDVPITVVGESLGSSVACYAASKGSVDRLALVSPFSSVTDVARRFAPFLPVKFLLKDKYRSVDLVRSSNIPFHILHGTHDTVVPIDLGRKLFEAYPGNQKTFTALEGFNHYTINRALSQLTLAEPFRRFIRGEDAEQALVASPVTPLAAPQTMTAALDLEQTGEILREDTLAGETGAE